MTPLLPPWLVSALSMASYNISWHVQPAFLMLLLKAFLLYISWLAHVYMSLLREFISLLIVSVCSEEFISLLIVTICSESSLILLSLFVPRVPSPYCHCLICAHYAMLYFLLVAFSLYLLLFIMSLNLHSVWSDLMEFPQSVLHISVAMYFSCFVLVLVN